MPTTTQNFGLNSMSDLSVLSVLLINDSGLQTRVRKHSSLSNVPGFFQ